MPELTVIWWRDIPAQVTAKEGRARAARELPTRFQEAIDAAAMRAGLIGTDAYLEEWRREARACGDDLEAEVDAGGRRGSRPHYTDECSSGSSAQAGRGDRVTETVLSSATKEVVIGFDRPFVVIGERINPTGRKALAEEMAAGNFDTVVADAIAQVEAGAQMLDVNAGIPLADEPAILAHTSSSSSRSPTCRSRSTRRSSRRSRRGSRSTRARRSSTRSRARTSRWSACCRSSRSTAPRSWRSRTTRRGSARIPDVRFEVARKIVSRADDHGIPREDVVVDPLVMPIGAMGTAGRQVFRLAPAAPGRAPGQHDVRRVERQLRAARTAPGSTPRSCRWRSPPA